MSEQEYASEGGVFRPKLDIDGQFTIVHNDWIRKSELTPPAMLLYIYLSGHEAGYELRFPQIKRETRLGDRALRSALNELCEADWVEATRVKKSDGRLGPYRYEVKNPPLNDGDVTRVRLATVDDATVDSASVDNRSHLKRETNKNINKEKEYSEAFEKFWGEYPKKEGKTTSYQAFNKALKSVSAEELIQAAKDYALLTRNKDKQYIRKAYNWLKDEDYLSQEKPKPEGGSIWDQPTI